MKKILFVFPMVVLLAAGCNASQQASVQTQSHPVQNTTPAPTVSPTPAQTTDWHTYINTQFGFQLSFTDAWKGYRVKFQQPGGYTLVFAVPKEDKNYTDGFADAGYATEMKIEVIPLAQWNAIDPKTYGPLPSLLGQDSAYVFAYSIPPARLQPLDLKNVDFGIPQIVSSFKLIQ
jgi:hypothetical protein